jgi:RNA polymerase sigma-70 factor, ECF subfamily
VPQTRSSSRPRSAVARADDEALLHALRNGDEATFAQLVDAWGPVMLRMALVHMPNRAVAEEVVQEAWLTVLRTLGRFERRSALRTWVLGIVVNLARSRARAERRCAPLPDAAALFGPGRFRPPDDPWPDHWAVGPVPWPTPEDELLVGEARDVVLAAVAALPPAQREVMILRDLHGWTAPETCNVMGLSDTNQRVLLHRARSQVRKAIEDYLGATETT